MATTVHTISSSAWVQVSTGNVYIENTSKERILYWACSVTAPSIAAANGHVIGVEKNEQILLNQAVWCRTTGGTITIPCTEF